MPPPLTTSSQEASVRTALQIELTARVSDIRKFFASPPVGRVAPDVVADLADRSLQPRRKPLFSVLLRIGLFQQLLKTRMVAYWIPNRIEF